MAISWDKVQANGKEMSVYTAVPDRPGPLPCVVIAQHAFGNDETIQDFVARLHREGYVVAAPELFSSEQQALHYKQRTAQFKDQEVIADMNAALAHAKSKADVSRAGVTGFCMGGRIALLMAAANHEFKASVIHYGGNTMKPWGENQGPTPFERIKDVGCPILGLFGIEDENPTPTDTAKISADLTKHGKWHEFHTFQDTAHGFHDFLHPERYRERAAASAWSLLLAFFDTYLKQGREPGLARSGA